MLHPLLDKLIHLRKINLNIKRCREFKVQIDQQQIIVQGPYLL
jgi:hypothetical protein